MCKPCAARAGIQVPSGRVEVFDPDEERPDDTAADADNAADADVADAYDAAAADDNADNPANNSNNGKMGAKGSNKAGKRRGSRASQGGGRARAQGGGAARGGTAQGGGGPMTRGGGGRGGGRARAQGGGAARAQGGGAARGGTVQGGGGPMTRGGGRARGGGGRAQGGGSTKGGGQVQGGGGAQASSSEVTTETEESAIEAEVLSTDDNDEVDYPRPFFTDNEKARMPKGWFIPDDLGRNEDVGYRYMESAFKGRLQEGLLLHVPLSFWADTLDDEWWAGDSYEQDLRKLSKSVVARQVVAVGKVVGIPSRGRFDIALQCNIQDDEVNEISARDLRRFIIPRKTNCSAGSKGGVQVLL